MKTIRIFIAGQPAPEWLIKTKIDGVLTPGAFYFEKPISFCWAWKGQFVISGVGFGSLLRCDIPNARIEGVFGSPDGGSGGTLLLTSSFGPLIWLRWKLKQLVTGWISRI